MVIRVTDRLLTAREVGEHLGVSTETVLRWTRRGVLPAIRLPGGALRFRPKELEAALDEWEAGTARTRRASDPTGGARAGIVSSLVPATREEDDDAS